MFYKSLSECCRLSWPDMRILPEDDRVWLQQVGRRVPAARVSVCREVCNCAKLHPALTYTRPFMSAGKLQRLTFITQLTMIFSIWVWSLGGKSCNCFSVMMFCSRSFIIYFVRAYFTVTVDHLVVYSLGMLWAELRVSDWGSVPAPAPEKSQAVKVAE